MSNNIKLLIPPRDAQLWYWAADALTVADGVEAAFSPSAPGDGYFGAGDGFCLVINRLRLLPSANGALELVVYNPSRTRLANYGHANLAEIPLTLVVPSGVRQAVAVKNLSGAPATYYLTASGWMFPDPTRQFGGR